MGCGDFIGWGEISAPGSPTGSAALGSSQGGASGVGQRLAFVDQHIGNLRQYRGIAIDVGDQDGLRTGATRLHEVLDTYGIANMFEICPGTHTSTVADRFQNHVMPFFNRNLCSTPLALAGSLNRRPSAAQ